MTYETNAGPEEFMKSLAGVDFPTSKARIVGAAKDKGGFDTEVMHVLERIADRSYDDAADLTTEVRRVYATDGGLGDAGPAAPSRESDEDKGLIEQRADPRSGESS